MLAGCEELSLTNASGAADARAPVRDAAPPPPSGKGCRRGGTLESIESDPHCVLDHVPEDAMREFSKRIKMAIVAEPDTVMSGSSVLLRISLTNVASTDSLVVLEEFTRPPGARPDWTRIMGVPDVRGAVDTPHLYVSVVTLDSQNRNVDGVPTVPGTAVPQTPARLLGVWLKPGEKLTHTVPWWAYRIPPAPPVVKDDAGHRFYPKTGAIGLWPADYIASVELPLHGLPPVERTVAARIHVIKSSAVVVPTARKPPPPPAPDDAGAEDGSAPDAAVPPK